MPYIIRPRFLPPVALAAATALLGIATASAQATTIDTSHCEAPMLSQPFAAQGDPSDYAPAPGQTASGFTAAGWTLSGGAKITKVTLGNGQSTAVLNMPSGSTATSPGICVTSKYTTARAVARNVAGGNPVGFSVGYAGTASLAHPEGGGDIHTHNTEWTLSDQLNMSAEHQEGWQLAHITLVSKAGNSDVQIAQLYLGVPSGQAAPTLDTSRCAAPGLSQVFLGNNDSDYYFLAPGQSAGGFEGQGWTLSGGASVTATTLPSGRSGDVLNLPSGSTATSPVICVTTAYPSARMFARNLAGADAVGFSVGYVGTDSYLHIKGGGDIHGGQHGEWALSGTLNMSPEHVEGWQLVQITLFAKGNNSDAQLAGLYIDPYSR